MEILLLNWRDIKNPSSGGAEILTHEMSKRWVAWGHMVTVFSSHFPGSLSKEIIDGVTVLRRGNPDIRNFFASVHFFAFLYYLREARGNFDVIIDEIHGIPFFTPWYAKEKKIVLICEIAGDLWVKIFGQFFGILGHITERVYLKMIYNKVKFATISQSSRNDLLQNGIKDENIIVLPMGVNVPNTIGTHKKEKNKTLIFVGRLTIAKGVEDAIFALKELMDRSEDLYLWIVGRGDKHYEQRLKKICEDLRVIQRVTFFGFVSEKEKFKLLEKAHILIHPSLREGFGLTIPEAGYVGTPVIAYNSPGLRDIVKNNKNGVLLMHNSPKEIAKEANRILKYSNLYKKLCRGAMEEARRYNWDNTAKIMLACLEKL